MENGILKLWAEYSGVFIAFGLSLFPDPLSGQWTKLRFVSVHTHTWKHTYICSYVSYPAIYIDNHGGGPSPGMEAFLGPPNALKDCIAQKEEGIKDYFSNVGIKTNQMLPTFFLNFLQPLGVFHFFLQTNLHFSGYMIGTVLFIGRSL